MPLEPAGFQHVQVDLAATPVEPVLFAPDVLANPHLSQLQSAAVEHSPLDLTILNSTLLI
jgi:hypothetical protein